MGMPSGSRPMGIVITGYAVIPVSMMACLLKMDRMRKTHKLEQRFVGLRLEHHRTGGRRERYSCRLGLGEGLRLYRSRGIAYACGRKQSSKLVT
jgi:hypothetical protein